MKFAADNKDIIKKMYIEDKKPLREIASTLHTYPTKILRALKYLNIEIRDKSEAQAQAIKDGRFISPTKGKKRDDATKVKISNTVAESWKNKTTEEKEKICKDAAERWKNMPELEKQQLQKLAHEGLRKAAEEGSALEKSLVDGLAINGYNVMHHYNPIEKTKLEVDIFLPGTRVAIEVDGPSHFLPIWGDEVLKKNISSDNEKNGILVLNGLCVIRVQCAYKTFSNKNARDVLDAVLEKLKSVEEKWPPLEDRIIRIRLGDI